MLKPVGKEEKIAMEVAAQNYNNISKTHKVLLHFGDALRVASVGKLFVIIISCSL
jgi:hypothetical protein